MAFDTLSVVVFNFYLDLTFFRVSSSWEFRREIIKNSRKKNLDLFFQKGFPNKKLVNIEVPDIDKFNQLKGSRKSLRSISSLLSVQEGCDKFCSFCVVPYTRGVEISRPANQILKEAVELVENGAKEIILLGQNVNAWLGKGLNETEWTFPRLIKELSELDIERIRYITSHPRDMTDELMRSHKDIEKLQNDVAKKLGYKLVDHKLELYGSKIKK